MNRRHLLILALIISFSSIIQAQNSYIQVVAEPGISVFLDGQFKGKTTANLEGLIIENLSAGTYTIKVVKEGSTPQEETVAIEDGEVFMYTVKPFNPKVRIRQQGNEDQQDLEHSTGSLKIQSIPIGIRIEVPSVGINSSKTKDEWFAEDLPIGNYPIRFYWNNKVLKGTIIIFENKQTEVFVNFVDRTIDYRGETANEHEKRLIEWVYDEGARTRTEGISFDLAGRQARSLPKPKHDIQSEGIVVVEVTVDRNGNVTQAVPGVKGSTTLEEYFLRVAREAAMASKFDRKPDAPVIQKGTITYHFILR